jgi:NADPH:quinone reductase-like Zn-dependent oxidoreductase
MALLLRDRRKGSHHTCWIGETSRIMKTMKAVVFKGKDRIAVEEALKPTPRAGEAVIRVTTTTICGTDVHIVRSEYPVKAGPRSPRR